MNENEDMSLYDRIVGVLHTDLEEKSVVIRWAAWRLKLIYEIIEKFWWDNCPTFAASLAYTTLLTLAPLAAVFFSILSSFAFSKDQVLNFIFHHLLPNEEMAAIIESNIDTFAANATSVSVFGLFFLAFFSIWMMRTIESAFNMIWKVDKPRPVINQFVAYWSTLTFAPILIAFSVVATAKIQALVLSESWAEYSYLQGFILKAIPYLLTWLAFFLVYRLVPYTNVYFKPAWIGAIVAGTMFEAAKLGFNYYLSNWATYTAIYGALAVIPIFLFWLYVTWLIVLLGSVIAYAIQYPKEIHSEKHEGFDRSKYQNYYALRLLVEATRSFEAGLGSLDPKAVQEKLEITSEFYGDLLRKLKKLELIEFVDGSEERFLLKKPASDIKVADVVTRLDGEMFSAAPEPADSDGAALAKFFDEIREAVSKGAGELSLLELATRLQDALSAGSVVELIKDNAGTA